MSAGPELDDIERRLVDLADSAGPWDDPLPEIRRRAAAMTADSDPVAGGSSVFRPPGGGRTSRRWFRSVDPEKAVAAAAVVALVAGLGWLIHSGGPSSEKSSSAAPALASSAAGAAGSAAPSSAAQGQSVPGPGATAALCVWPAPTSAVSLRAPARVRTGAVLSVGVRLTGSAAADVYSPLVVVLSKGRVVGRLVPTLIPPGPNLRPPSPTVTTTTVTGTLRRSTCTQVTASFRSRVPRAAGSVLPPGRYQLFAVATAAGARVASFPVTVTVIR
jgi:hypothetical protein